MAIIKGGPFGWIHTGPDKLELLEIDHDHPGSNWFSRVLEYEHALGIESVVHIHPNKGAHSSTMWTNDEGLDLCLCDCELGYDMDDEGNLMVIHNYEEDTLSTG